MFEHTLARYIQKIERVTTLFFLEKAEQTLGILKNHGIITSRVDNIETLGYILNMLHILRKRIENG